MAEYGQAGRRPAKQASKRSEKGAAHTRRRSHPPEIPHPPPPMTTTRITIDLNDMEYNALYSLKQDTGARSIAQVIRRLILVAQAEQAVLDAPRPPARDHSSPTSTARGDDLQEASNTSSTRRERAATRSRRLARG